MSDTEQTESLPASLETGTTTNRNQRGTEPSTTPTILFHRLLPADHFYPHAPSVLVTDDGDRVYFLRAETADLDHSALLAWEGTRGGFTAHAGVDATMFRLPKGDTSQ